MTDLITRLSALHRPRILIRAARIGASAYSRNRHLPRLLGYGNLPKIPIAVSRLFEQEQLLDQRRRHNDPGYSLTGHINVLIALMGEAQLLQQEPPSYKRPEKTTALATLKQNELHHVQSC